MIGSWDLQVAIYDALKIAGITGGRIYDQRAPLYNVTYPFTQIGATEARNVDAIGISGVEETLPLHIWDRGNEEGGQRGIKNVKEISAQIDALLNGQSINIEGRDSAFCIVTGFDPIDEADPLTAHGVVTLQVRHYKKQD